MSRVCDSNERRSSVSFPLRSLPSRWAARAHASMKSAGETRRVQARRKRAGRVSGALRAVTDASQPDCRLVSPRCERDAPDPRSPEPERAVYASVPSTRQTCAPCARRKDSPDVLCGGRGFVYAYQPRRCAIWRFESRGSRDGCGRVPKRKQRFSEGKMRVIWRKEATP